MREIRVYLNEERIKKLIECGLYVSLDNNSDEINIFRIEENEIYFKIEQLLKQWNAWIVRYTDFSNEDILSARYYVFKGMHTCGYPKPDHNFGYLNLTYDLTDYCEECGVGKVQKDAFRISKIAKHKMFELGWIYDELFVHKDVYDRIFRPLGIRCREVIRYHKDIILDSVVQLVIPETSEIISLRSDYEHTTCRKCGRIKYSPQIIGFPPLHKKNIAAIYKGVEYYGAGHEARRFIYVSSELKDLLIKHNLIRSYFLCPCK